MQPRTRELLLYPPSVGEERSGTATERQVEFTLTEDAGDAQHDALLLSHLPREKRIDECERHRVKPTLREVRKQGRTSTVEASHFHNAPMLDCLKTHFPQTNEFLVLIPALDAVTIGNCVLTSLSTN